ncbi:MAG: hypothetical protein QME74_06355, partial [Candidatus Edwardsbacteria bacterium]|nr:hypothetical protein [Candidatus Edwardsbacteria bacterium]
RRRTDHAWQEFGGEQCYRDDRGRIWVRYGQPAERYRSPTVWRYLNTKQLAGGAMMRDRPWEVWLYPHEGLYYNFIEFNNAYRIWAMVRLDRRHPIAFFKKSMEPKFSLPAVAARDKPVERPLECRWARFRSSSSPDKVRWELYWRIPVEAVKQKQIAAAFALTDAKGPAPSPSLPFGVNSAEGKVTVDTVWYDVVVPADSLPEPYAFGQRNLDLDPGHYQLEITVFDGAGTAYQARTEAELIAYRPGIQECSDVELARLQDTTSITPDFQKGKFKRVIPQVAGEIPTRQPYFVYYEVYNLRTDAKGNHHVRVRLQMFQPGRDTLAERPFAAGEFSYEEPGAEFHGCHCVYPQDLGEGELYLLIGVEDQLSGRVTKLIKNLRLKE